MAAKVLTLRISAAELAAWTAFAHGNGAEVAAWARQVLNLAAQARKQPSDELPAVGLTHEAIRHMASPVRSAAPIDPVDFWFAAMKEHGLTGCWQDKTGTKHDTIPKVSDFV